jgi:Flp pilus assembly protein TadD
MVHFLFGQALEKTGATEEAEDQYRTILQLDPGCGPAYINLANILTNRGRLEEALSYLQQDLRICPQTVHVHNGLGQTLARMGRYDEAADHFRRAVELDGSDPRLLNHWGTALLKKGDLIGAAGRYEAATRLKPSDPRGWYNLAHTLHLKGDGSAARPVYRRAVRLDPGWPRKAANEAWILATDPDPRFRDPPEAVRLAEQAVQAVEAVGGQDLPTLVFSLDAVAAAYATAGRFSEAVDAGRRGLAILASRSPQAAGELQARVRLYEQGIPFRLVASATRPAGP